MEATTYRELNIHRRINAKNNATIYYSHQREGKGLLRRVSSSHPGLYSSKKMLLEPEGIHNNRNYDGPEPDYNGWSAAEESHRMSEYQKLK